MAEGLRCITEMIVELKWAIKAVVDVVAEIEELGGKGRDKEKLAGTITAITEEMDDTSREITKEIEALEEQKYSKEDLVKTVKDVAHAFDKLTTFITKSRYNLT